MGTTQVMPKSAFQNFLGQTHQLTISEIPKDFLKNNSLHTHIQMKNFKNHNLVMKKTQNGSANQDRLRAAIT